MPYGNSDKNTDKELYAEIARLLNVTVPTARKYVVDGVYEAIVRFLYLKGKCTIPNLGTFSLVHEKESYQTQTDAEGNEVVYRVPARDKPVFTPHDTFINDVNCLGVTKAYRKRAKKNQLTAMDYRRQQRAIELGDYGSMTEERANAAKQDFKELLEQKKKGSKEKED